MVVDDDIDEFNVFNYWNMTARFNQPLLYATVLTSTACNLACPYCYQSGILEKSQHRNMTLHTASQVVALMSKMKQQNRLTSVDLGFFGGEPLLNIESIELISEGIRRDWSSYNFSVTTNGTLLTAPVIETLQRCEVSRLQVSVDGTEEIHNERRKLKGHNCFRTVVGNILKATESGLSVCIAVNIDNHNWVSVPALIGQLADMLPTDRISIGLGFIFDPSVSKKHCTRHLVINEMKPSMLAPILDSLKTYGIPLANRPGFGSCSFQSPNMIVVDSTGDLYSCVSGVGIHAFRIGSADDGYNNTRMWDMRGRSPDFQQSCRTCAVLPVCKGGCRFQAHLRGLSSRSLYCQRKLYEQVYTVVARHLYEDELIARYVDAR